MVFIIIVEIIIYLVFIAWTWQNLGTIEKKKKVIFILVGTIVIYGITWIICPKSEIYIEVPTQDLLQESIQKKIQNTLITIFTGVNGIILLPQMGKICDSIKEDEIKKEKVKKKILIWMIIFVVCAIFENGYMRDTQKGILKVYEAMK